jgi:hypothetical protein
MEERWKRIDRAFWRSEELPPVSLYKVEGFYFVLDGHHRVSVARYHGVEWIEAYVTEFRTQFPEGRRSGGDRMSHEHGNQCASNELRRRIPVHCENIANVADEIASRQVVQDMQDAQSTNNDELFASASAEEHDYVALNDKVVSGTKKTEKGKKRTVYAPQAERDTKAPAVISVELDEDEDVEWIWTHTADRKSVVTGYIITKRSDKPRQRREVSDASKRSSSRQSM